MGEEAGKWRNCFLAELESADAEGTAQIFVAHGGPTGRTIRVDGDADAIVLRWPLTVERCRAKKNEVSGAQHAPTGDGGSNQTRHAPVATLVFDDYLWTGHQHRDQLSA